MDNVYGIRPGLAPLNTPYGLLTRPEPEPIVPLPTNPAIAAHFAQPRAPQTPAPIGILPEAGGYANAMQPGQGNVVPFRAYSPYDGTDRVNRVAPIVGKDIPIEKLVDIQRRAESSGNYQALNTEKKGNTASGAYQYTDRTWNNYGGYPKAMLAPKEVQDRRFAEDIAKRVNKYNGDLFKAIAAHYLPAFADDPSKWREPQKIRVKGGTVTVRPVETYLRHVLKNSPYEKQLDEYLNAYQ